MSWIPSLVCKELFGRPAPAYATHVPLSRVQSGALAVLGSLGALAWPWRADLVAATGETTAGPALRALRDRMAADPVGRRILAERPRVTDAVFGRARGLPQETFGGAYAAFMGTRGFSADERPPVRFVRDAELAYVITRAREVHDFWHVLFGCHTDVFGEVALKGMEFVQTGLPMTGMAVLAGEVKLAPALRSELNAVFLPWALRAGAQAADLMCIYYEEHLDDDLEAMRRRYRILKAPIPSTRSGAVPAGLGQEEKAQTPGAEPPAPDGILKTMSEVGPV